MSDARQIQQLVPEAVYRTLGSRPKGLNAGEVAERLLEVGRNTVEVPDRWRRLRSLGRQFTNFFTILLLLSGIICFVADRIQPGESMDVLGWALFGVALLNAGFSFLQEYRAEKAMEELKKFLPPLVTVTREGRTDRIPAEELVPGDVLLIGEGERIPADARLVRSNDLMVNNAPLTGEAEPQILQAGASGRRLSESDNVVFAGCSILRGSGEAVVFATGIRSEFGKLAHLSQAIRRSPSPLERETAHMVRVLTVIAVTMGITFFLYGVFSGRSLWINLVFMMGIIVANVPEGLLPTFTLSLAMGSLRMARKNVLVKGLNAVEALGAVHVICTDKTGTLTRNQLSLTHLVEPMAGEPLPDAAGRSLLALALASSDVRPTGAGFSGDPLDVAIAECYHEGGGDLASIAASRKRFFAFDAGKRRAAGIVEGEGGEVFVVKGAWEALKPMLGGVQPPGAGAVDADASALARVEQVVHRLAGSGLRVIAVAWRGLEPKEAEGEQEELERQLVLAGLLGVEDPVREEVPAAVAECGEAGIDVIMITGDHPDTALAVARKCGIVDSGTAGERLLTGDALQRLRESELVERLEGGVRIFARTTPEQKMKIVAALKTLDKVVAMTGDGVNDAPALKAADVGVAMGRSGTDVARAAAQIILLDDNFASIVAGVEEGRTVFANIRKFTTYALSHISPEVVPFVLYILLPVPLGLTAVQILAIDLGTEILPSLGLGREPPDPEEMQGPARQEAGLLTPGLVLHSYLFLGLIETGWSLLLFFLVLKQGGWRYGMDLPLSAPLYRSATSIVLATIVLMQMGNLISRRHRSRSGFDRGLMQNWLFLFSFAASAIFTWALLYFPPVQRVLGTGPVPLSVYFLAWLGIPLIFGLDYLRKRLCGRGDVPAVNFRR